LLPDRILAQIAWVPHYNQQRLGPSYCDVKSLREGDRKVNERQRTYVMIKVNFAEAGLPLKKLSTETGKLLSQNEA